ncbi:MAG TPA: GspMb/PilO family protein [Dissulfurispiraceae bacterium]|nr:GspMb/PilO family protein [Dissulfurispiraceae bacterium]
MKKNNRLRLIGIPLAIILFLLVFYKYVYVGAMTEIASLREQQDAKMATLKKYVNLIAQKPELEKQLAALREQSKAQDEKLISGEPASLASANLQGLVKDAVTGKSGTITSERVGKAEELEKITTSGQTSASATAKPASDKKTAKSTGARLQVLSVSIDSTIPDTAALSDILYSLETRIPYIVMKELDVRVRNFRDPRELMVRLDAMGLYEGR